MRALVLAHSFPRFAGDPVGSFVLRLATALRAHDVETLVIAPSAAGLPRHDRLEGIPVQRFRYAPSHRETLAYTGTMRDQVRESTFAKFAMMSFLASELAITVRSVASFAPDIIHAHWWYPNGLVATLARAARRVPVVVTLHGSDGRVAASSPFAAKLFRFVARHSARVTTVSSWLAAQVEAVAPGTSATVAPMPIVTELFSAGAWPREPRVLFVGKLNEQKGIAPFLRALARMRHTPPADVVIGVGSDDREAKAMAAELRVGDRITWHPLLGQAELAAMYRRASVLVMPAVNEGLGLVAAESLLSRTPVVAFDSGGVPDIVRDGATGRLVAPGDDAALARAVDEILDLPDGGAAIGAAGREWVLHEMSADAAAARYASIYEDAVRPRGR